MDAINLVAYPHPINGIADDISNAVGKSLKFAVFPKPTLSLGGMKDHNPRTVAGYAWGMYGFLAMVNCTYYMDYVYRHYTVDRFAYLGLATRQLFALGNFFRTVFHLIVWFIAVLLWALTFT